MIMLYNVPAFGQTEGSTPLEQIAQAISALQNAIIQLGQALGNEVQARISGDASLQTQIDTITDQNCSVGRVVTGIDTDGNLVCGPEILVKHIEGKPLVGNCSISGGPGPSIILGWCPEDPVRLYQISDTDVTENSLISVSLDSPMLDDNVICSVIDVTPGSDFLIRCEADGTEIQPLTDLNYVIINP